MHKIFKFKIKFERERGGRAQNLEQYDFGEASSNLGFQREYL